jgi:hypothetical protein
MPDNRGTFDWWKLGSGVVNALGLIVDLIFADGQIFVIEELENDMHPKALKSLLDLMRISASSGNQFFVSTHSHIVLRRLGAEVGAKVFHVKKVADGPPPHSQIYEIPPTPIARRELLFYLGYEILDYELYDAWMLLEESSAEAIIREFLVPWFVPALAGRLRTVAAAGVSDLEPKVSAFVDLFLFLHLEATYGLRAWVFADNDDVGRNVIERLRVKFNSWPPDHFRTFSEPAFELYYPQRFAADVRRILAITERVQRREEKRLLLIQAVEWLRIGDAEQRDALLLSAAPVIGELNGIAQSIGAIKG